MTRNMQNFLTQQGLLNSTITSPKAQHYYGKLHPSDVLQGQKINIPGSAVNIPDNILFQNHKPSSLSAASGKAASSNEVVKKPSSNLLVETTETNGKNQVVRENSIIEDGLNHMRI